MNGCDGVVPAIIPHAGSKSAQNSPVLPMQASRTFARCKDENDREPRTGRVARVYAELPAQSRILFGLWTRCKLSVAEIVRVRGLSVVQVRAILARISSEFRRFSDKDAGLACPRRRLRTPTDQNQCWQITPFTL